MGYSAGGGYDVYSRLLARHIPQNIPGKPNAVVQNMPGAGSAKAASYIYSAAPRDGMAIGSVAPGVIIAPLLDSKFELRYDPTGFIHIGTADSVMRVCATLLPPRRARPSKPRIWLRIGPQQALIKTVVVFFGMSRISSAPLSLPCWWEVKPLATLQHVSSNFNGSSALYQAPMRAGSATGHPPLCHLAGVNFSSRVTTYPMRSLLKAKFKY